MTAQPISGRRVLAGKRVLVTRAVHQAGKLSDGLRALGAEPVEVPVLEIQPPAGYDAIDLALRSTRYLRLADFDQRQYRAGVSGAGGALGLSLTSKAGLKVAAIGEATATAARNAGFAVSLIPETYVAEAMVERLARQAAGRRFCWRGLKLRAM